MKNIYLLVSKLLLICLFIAGFSDSAYLEENGLGLDNQNQILSGYITESINVVDVTRSFDIDIQCNLTTGYDIVVTYFPGAVQLTKFISEPPSDRRIMGAPSKCRYTFKLAQPVGTKIFFTNVRVSNYEVGKTIEYQINVKGK